MLKQFLFNISFLEKLYMLIACKVGIGSYYIWKTYSLVPTFQLFYIVSFFLIILLNLINYRPLTINLVHSLQSFDAILDDFTDLTRQEFYNLLIVVTYNFSIVTYC